jgi:hypothetical protein
MHQVLVGQGLSALVLDPLTGTEEHRFVLTVPTKVPTVSAVDPREPRGAIPEATRPQIFERGRARISFQAFSEQPSVDVAGRV